MELMKSERACLPACMHACMPAYPHVLLGRLLACTPVHLPACLSACLPALVGVTPSLAAAACKFDLRFVPEEQSFEGRKVRDEATEVPAGETGLVQPRWGGCGA